MEGWIKLHRRFVEWEWFDDPEAMRLFLYLLLSANHKDGKWKGIPIKRGQLITGLHSLSEKLNLSIKIIRNRLDKLEKTGEIDRQSGNQYSVVTICNYDKYQYTEEQKGKPRGKPRASGGQAEGKPRATNKNVKNYENVKNEKNISLPDGFNEVFIRWMNYKDERKENLTPLGIQTFITKMLTQYGYSLNRFRDAVDNSIAMNYQGVYPPKDNKSKAMS